MKKTRLLGVVGMAAASFVLLTGFAGGHRGHHDPEKMAAMLDKRVERMLDKVEATDAQREQIRAIKERVASRMQEQRGERGQAKQEMLSFWNQANPDAAEVHARIDARLEQRRAMAHEMADALLEVHAILTPEQRAIVAQELERKGERKGKKQRKAPAQQ